MSSSGRDLVNLKSFLNSIENTIEPDKRDDKFLKRLPHRFHYYDIKLKPPMVMNVNNGQSNKKVVKLRFMHDPDVNIYPERRYKSKPSACLVITYEDGARLTKSIKESELINVQKLFITQMTTEQEVTEHFAFSKIGGWIPNWKHTPISFAYDSVNTKHYEKLYALIISKIESILREESKKKFFIIDGGCGNGNLIVAAKKNNDLKQLSADYMGFDFNEKNIADCKKHNSPVLFVEGNLFDIDNILKNNKVVRDDATILILSGSLTSQVLHDAFQAVDVLQKAARGKVDYLIGGGVGEPLFTDHMAKRIGYKKISTTDNENASLNFFAFERLAIKKILDNKIKKIIKSNFLDLSFSPNPEDILKQLINGNYLNNNLTIDLSFCSFTPELRFILSGVVKDFPNTKIIFWQQRVSFGTDKRDPVTEFVEYFKSNPQLTNNFPLSSITSCSLRDTDQVYMMAPKSFFIALHELEETSNSAGKNEVADALTKAKTFIDASKASVNLFSESRSPLFSNNILDHKTSAVQASSIGALKK